jgi:hypothetical protein
VSPGERADPPASIGGGCGQAGPVRDSHVTQWAEIKPINPLDDESIKATNGE